MSSLLTKLLKNSTVEETAIISESRFFGERDMVRTHIPALNIAFAGRIDAGFSAGVTMWAGPSRHFKTLFGLIMVAAYLKKYPEAVCILYDTEFGSPLKYFASVGIDPARVIHTPISSVEQLKSDLVTQLNGIEYGDKVIVMVDSIGNAASNKEVSDALAGEVKADFTRAKELKSMFRMVMSRLIIKDIPLVVVNHTYKEMSMHPREIVSGGTGGIYNSDSIFIVGRQQEKDATGLVGYNFIINVEKSRHVKEKSKIPISVTFDEGLSTWSGLLEIAVELGFVEKAKPGYYHRIEPTTGEVLDSKPFKEVDTDTADFWIPMLQRTDFQKAVQGKYALGEIKMLTDDEVERVYEAAE